MERLFGTFHCLLDCSTEPIIQATVIGDETDETSVVAERHLLTIKVPRIHAVAKSGDENQETVCSKC